MCRIFESLPHQRCAWNSLVWASVVKQEDTSTKPWPLPTGPYCSNGMKVMHLLGMFWIGKYILMYSVHNFIRHAHTDRHVYVYATHIQIDMYNTHIWFFQYCVIFNIDWTTGTSKSILGLQSHQSSGVSAPISGTYIYIYIRPLTSQSWNIHTVHIRQLKGCPWCEYRPKNSEGPHKWSRGLRHCWFCWLLARDSRRGV